MWYKIRSLESGSLSIARNHMLQNLVVVLMERPMLKVQVWRVVRIVQQVNLGAVLTNLLMQLDLMV